MFMTPNSAHGWSSSLHISVLFTKHHTALFRTEQHQTAQNSTEKHGTAVTDSTEQYYNILYKKTQLYTTLYIINIITQHNTAQQNTAMENATQNYKALHNTVKYCTAL